MCLRWVIYGGRERRLSEFQALAEDFKLVTASRVSEELVAIEWKRRRSPIDIRLVTEAEATSEAGHEPWP